jgi:hypothetical protein
MIQLFKSYPNKPEFITFIKTHCIKEQKCYKLSQEIYKQILFKNALQPYIDTLKSHYHISKQTYITRKMTYSRFITIIRHLCKLLEITYTSTMKYSNSTYQIDYLFYLNDYE